jgi:hypothetical protein
MCVFQTPTLKSKSCCPSRLAMPAGGAGSFAATAGSVEEIQAIAIARIRMPGLGEHFMAGMF